MKALDLACGKGRHALWLAARGWDVTAVDQIEQDLPGVRYVRADLERGEFTVEPGAWDLIVCWLYWQADLLPSIAAGLGQGGVVALAGKTTGRFATSLSNYRNAFPGWTELDSGESADRAFFIARRSGEKLAGEIEDVVQLFGVADCSSGPIFPSNGVI